MLTLFIEGLTPPVSVLSNASEKRELVQIFF